MRYSKKKLSKDLLIRMRYSKKKLSKDLIAGTFDLGHVSGFVILKFDNALFSRQCKNSNE